MKTEQAHSLGGTRFRASGDLRKQVPPRPDAVPRRRDPRTTQRAVPTVWLNLLCLDAPIVAGVWLWLFARTFSLPVPPGNAVALFLTAWLIYLADRLADAVSLNPVMPRSLRQEFCLRHREIWISALILIGGFDVYVIWRSIASETFLAGAVVGILALIYLASNYPKGRVWRSFPAKEVAIGLPFTAGMLVALLPSARLVTPAFIASALAFACLCSLNCISIAAWERRLDQAQEKVTVATQHPGLARQTGKICAALALFSFAMAMIYRPAAPVFVCACVSALLLGWLNASAGFKERRFEIADPEKTVVSNRRSLGVHCDQRAALADLVLLTPIIPLIATAL